MTKQENGRRAEYKEKYENALMAYEEERRAFERRKAQYDGDHRIEGGKDAEVVWNFTMELIESQIDSYLPQPKVTAKRPTEKNKRLAAVIEDMIKNEMDRLPFENMNDEDERTVKTKGGSAYLVEWDNALQTHDTVGGLSVRLLDPEEMIPQEGVYYLRCMDHLFVVFEETKSRIAARYGEDVTDEGVEGGTATGTDETCTQVICYYINGKGRLGCFSWTGETTLIDDEDYEARKEEICAKCGKTRPMDEEKCACGSRKWDQLSMEYEELMADVTRSDGLVIPSKSPARKMGTYVMEEYEEQEKDPLTGLLMYERDLDENGLVVGEVPKMKKKERARYVATKIPYYYPMRFPIAIRKNVSAKGKVMGSSDCDAIRDFQIAANKLLTKVNKKLLGAGSYLTKPRDMNLTLSDEEVKPITVNSMDQLNMLKSITMNFDVTQDLSSVQQYYQMAKSTLGITDSFQGKADPTATSGIAKQALIAQAAGRQSSKQVMKNAAYAELFEMMFKYMLAYADEPRMYTSTNQQGEQVESVFNRYDFLEEDEAGAWYYEDGFLFSVDENGTSQRNRQFILEDLRTDFGIGAYGDRADPKTMLRYWKVKDSIHYPNAKQMVQEWQEEVEKQNQQMGDRGMPDMGEPGMRGMPDMGEPGMRGMPDMGELGMGGMTEAPRKEMMGVELENILRELKGMEPEMAFAMMDRMDLSEAQKVMIAEMQMADGSEMDGNLQDSHIQELIGELMDMEEQEAWDVIESLDIGEEDKKVIEMLYQKIKAVGQRSR